MNPDLTALRVCCAQAGWDRAFVADTPTNVSHTRANQAAFAAAVHALDALVMPVAACAGPAIEIA